LVTKLLDPDHLPDRFKNRVKTLRQVEIDTILFDLDGTLRHNRPSSEHTFFDFAARLGVADSLEKRRIALRWSHEYWAQSVVLMEDLETYKGQEDLFWINYSRRHLISFDCPEDLAMQLAPEMAHLMKEEHSPQDYVPPEVPETLLALKEAGFRLGVVSNRTKSYVEQLKTLNLFDYFDCTIAAGEISAWKPEPEIFFHAARQLGVQPEGCLYVGDNYYADVIGAQRAGLTPVLLDPEGVFPDPGCEVICALEELTRILDRGPLQSLTRP
jgi:HAD superfamily hydrolase (TIGR01509 family)